MRPLLFNHKINWLVASLVIVLHGLIAYALITQLKPPSPHPTQKLMAQLIINEPSLDPHKLSAIQKVSTKTASQKAVKTTASLKPLPQQATSQQAQMRKKLSKSKPESATAKKIASNMTQAIQPEANKQQISPKKQAERVVETMTKKKVIEKMNQFKATQKNIEVKESKESKKLSNHANTELKEESKNKVQEKMANTDKETVTVSSPQKNQASESKEKHDINTDKARQNDLHSQATTEGQNEKLQDQVKKSNGINQKAECRTPRPAYPGLSRKDGEEGQVKIRMTVTASGKISNPSISKSSGYDRLDQAALNAVSTWDCHAAIKDGEQHNSTVVVPVNFNLDE